MITLDLPEDVKDHRGFYKDSFEDAILHLGERSVAILAEVLDNADLDKYVEP